MSRVSPGRTSSSLRQRRAPVPYDLNIYDCYYYYNKRQKSKWVGVLMFVETENYNTSKKLPKRLVESIRKSPNYKLQNKQTTHRDHPVWRGRIREWRARSPCGASARREETKIWRGDQRSKITYPAQFSNNYGWIYWKKKISQRYYKD